MLLVPYFWFGRSSESNFRFRGDASIQRPGVGLLRAENRFLTSQAFQLKKSNGGVAHGARNRNNPKHNPGLYHLTNATTINRATILAPLLGSPSPFSPSPKPRKNEASP